ncbi:nitrite reductase small subunit NirD [Herbaspirillum seropedicae]|uniref:Nitrite reductase NADPH (Small subunit) oxidoreductase protein n=1 Tax=Herbaspirillum seropedicae (strain SmR1) TaxID=757424 RepID=D8IZQ0_HERSS|nr:nitrite reductase small subunit NirD [Herbaspirillum seropedicae]ADJ64390.1 nitrite reductase NADPH (small subunit) oxidoreductase protein [Herbaspirillum seropedicae SmR1]AKN66323.1 nitrite reductase [Herbaspirillum seropedicae]NQE30570.1 nitrite reductase [Herbaspirillum seropedicae]UMU22315.1 nitrite reductase small subunit NirD [Herbaspirillum seropedicae]
MHSDQQIKHWTPVCELGEIVPNTGVAALVGDQQVAVFHVIDRSQGEPQPRVFAVGNYDPNCDAAVLSRGLVGNLGERIVVASPIYKHHFDLTTGECLEEPANSIPAWPARIADGKVWIGA